MMIDIRTLSDRALLNALTRHEVAQALHKSTQTAWRLRSGSQALTTHQRAELEGFIASGDEVGVTLRAAQVWEERHDGKH